METPFLEEIMRQWEKDSNVDSTEAGKELLRIPLLHNKYNKYLSLHTLLARKYALEYDKVKKLKWEYYTGKLDKEQLNKLGWEPFGFILKTDIGVYIDSDDDLNKLKHKKILHEETAKYCENVMRELSARTYQLRAFIDWEKLRLSAR
jgi:hypothetical protein